MILYINATNRNTSRTLELADYLLQEMNSDTTEVDLYENDLFDTTEDVIDLRDTSLKSNNFSDGYFDYAKLFSQADTIVIAAPFWDLSFPARLKQFIENITINGITFRYSDNGTPEGLCKAEKLFYITTAGGKITDDSFGYGYIKSLCKNLYGIHETYYIKAEMLDIDGVDTSEIINKSKEEISNLIKEL